MKQEELFEQRLKEHYDELKWLYCELYGSMDMFYRLCRTMKDFFVRRKDSLKQLDEGAPGKSRLVQGKQPSGHDDVHRCLCRLP